MTVAEPIFESVGDMKHRRFFVSADARVWLGVWGPPTKKNWIYDWRRCNVPQSL